MSLSRTSLSFTLVIVTVPQAPATKARNAAAMRRSGIITMDMFELLSVWVDFGGMKAILTAPAEVWPLFVATEGHKACCSYQGTCPSYVDGIC